MALVIIRRNPDDYGFDEIDEECISNPIWDNVCGGLHVPMKCYSVYGYTNYMNLIDSNIACSGLHADIAWNAKVCLNKNDNMDPDHIEGYSRLKVQAQLKYVQSFPYWEMIKFITSNGGTAMRRDVKQALMALDFDAREINSSIRTMIIAGYLEVEGSQRTGKALLSISSSCPSIHNA